ncbi:P-loop containing nucleoside triphosphate hydrolase protein [Suillus americanus]|nr:P-loop containing nucleoside triphosphate hydrolase protein [Suillus americanus]
MQRPTITRALLDLGKAANFPYTTINPEEARIPVLHVRFDWLCDLYKPASRVPAFLTYIDIAGLTAGASTGAEFGNAFLSHVRAVDGTFQVARAFDDAEVIHVEGDVDPLRNIEIIQTELRLIDIEWVEKHLDVLKRSGRLLGDNGLADKAKKEEIATVEKIYKAPSMTQLVEEGVNILFSLSLLSQDKALLESRRELANINGWIDAHNPGDPLIPFSVSLEERLAQLPDDERAEAQKEPGAQTALARRGASASTCSIRYLTCGPDEVRAWTIRKGTKAPQAAGVIHSDFENKFVCGEIMTYEDLKEHGSEAAVKAARKLRQQSKPYEMVDGVIAYRISG